jgi:hypothetical protein
MQQVFMVHLDVYFISNGTIDAYNRETGNGI